MDTDAPRKEKSPPHYPPGTDPAQEGWKAAVADRLALVAASGPYLCADRCDARLPDWPTVLNFVLDELLKTTAQSSSAQPPLLPEHNGASIGEDEGGDGDQWQRQRDLGLNVAALVRGLITSLYAEKGHLDHHHHHLNRVKACGCGGKDRPTAEALKATGNRLFTDKQYLLAFKFYTAAMATSPAEDGTAAVMRSNRSAASFWLRQFENALEDIAAAFRLGLPAERMAGKLLLRQAECLHALGRSEELAAFYQATESRVKAPAFSDAEKDRWQFLKGLPPLPKEDTTLSINLEQFLQVGAVVEALTSLGRFARRPDSQFQWLSAKVKLARDDAGKFRLIAEEAISPGEVLAVVKPFATVPLSESFCTSNNTAQSGHFERCHHCTATIYHSAAYLEHPKLLLKRLQKLLPNQPQTQTQTPKHIRMNNPIACPRCSTVLFCSEQCFLEAWAAYHRFECGHLPVLRCLGAEAHLALRALYATGSAAKVGELFREEEAEEEEEKEGGGCSTDVPSSKLLLSKPPQCARLEVIDEEYRRLHFTAELDGNDESRFRNMVTIHLLLNLAMHSGFLEFGNDCQFEDASWALLRLLHQLKRRCLVVARPNHRALSRTDAAHRFQVASSLAGIVEPATVSLDGEDDKKRRKVNLQLTYLNTPLEMVHSNVLLATATRSIAPGKKLAMDLSGGGHFETADKSPVSDLELLEVGGGGGGGQKN